MGLVADLVIRQSKREGKGGLRGVELGLLILAVAASGAGCSRDEPHPDDDSPMAAPRSVILVSIDTLRSDRLPAYGYQAIETPAIDRLRGDGILFRSAYSPAPLTTPAHTTLMTGLLPPEHGVRDNWGYRYDPTRGRTVAGRLRAAGYATGGFVSSFTLREETGLASGFDRYDAELGDATQLATIAEVQRRGDATLIRALEWLRTAPRPFFLFLHLYDPHFPFDPPEPFRSRYGATYEGEIAFADHLVGKLLAELAQTGLYEEIAIILLSDHGEGLDDHGEEEHGILLYRESLQVPLIVKLPGGARSGTTIDTPVQLSDVAPTLYALTGLDPVEGLAGRSLLDVTNGDDPRSIYAESYYPYLRFGWSPLTSLIKGNHHYIHSPTPELFDLEQDPGEQHDIVREERTTYLAMRRELESYDAKLESPYAEDRQAQMALQSLGYLGGGTTTSAGDGLDPKTQLHTLRPIQAGLRALRDNQRSEAIRLFESAIDTNPRLSDAWQFLGYTYSLEGRLEEAYHAYREALELSKMPVLADPLGRLAATLGRHDEAIPLLEVAISQRPDDAELHFLLTRSLLFEQRMSEALAAAEATLEIVPDHPDAYYQRGVAHLALQHPAEAQADLERAIELSRGGHIPALSDLAVLFQSQGRSEAARPLFERIRELQSQSSSQPRPERP